MSPFIAACKNSTPEVVQMFLEHPDIQLDVRCPQYFVLIRNTNLHDRELVEYVDSTANNFLTKKSALTTFGSY